MAPPDSELLHRYVTARDDAAFTQIVHRHIDLVYAAARRQVGDPHHAQEIAQAVFTTLARRAPALLSHPTLVGWLHTTTRYIASEGQRAERRRQQREAELILMNETENEPTPDWAALRPVIDEALERGGLDQESAVQSRREPGGGISLRWIIVHMIEEYARHNGHADLIRQSIDGQTGE